jgi:hypothetical protein
MSLSEPEKELLFRAGVVTAATLTFAGILWALATAPQAEAKNSVSIEATTGGTTSPSPGFYPFDIPTTISVVATVFVGYDFTGWYLNGNLVSTDLSYQLQVAGQNVLIASFELSGAPVLIPAFVKPVQSCVATMWWHTWRESVNGSLGFWLLDRLHLEPGYYVDGFVQFKICDQAGNGVPGQTLCLYTDPMPDVTDYGALLLNDALSSSSAPIPVVSDGDGIVTVRARYVWAQSGNFKETIGKAGKVHYSAWFESGDITPIFDRLESPAYTSLTSFTRLLNPIYRTLNPVHAYWQTNPNLLVYGDAIADCNVKIEDSKNY